MAGSLERINLNLRLIILIYTIKLVNIFPMFVYSIVVLSQPQTLKVGLWGYKGSYNKNPLIIYVKAAMFFN